MRSAGRTSTSDASYADDGTAGERGRARALRDRVMFFAPLRSRLRRRLRRVSTQAPSPAKPSADCCARRRPWAAASRQGRDVEKLVLEAANAHGECRAPGHRALSNDGHTATLRTCAHSQTLRRSRDPWGFRQGLAVSGREPSSRPGRSAREATLPTVGRLQSAPDRPGTGCRGSQHPRCPRRPTAP
jgi:hypothetical protein